jgi:hypothetical protein
VLLHLPVAAALVAKETHLRLRDSEEVTDDLTRLASTSCWLSWRMESAKPHA